MVLNDCKITINEDSTLPLSNDNACSCLFDLIASASSPDTSFDMSLLSKLSI